MFPSLSHFILFATATLVLNLIPGTDVLYIASQTLRSKKQGIMATLGTSTGIAVYILLTTLGLTAILSHSVWLLRWLNVWVRLICFIWRGSYGVSVIIRCMCKRHQALCFFQFIIEGFLPISLIQK